MVIKKVEISAWAKKQLRALPKRIVQTFSDWVDDVETLGLEEVRKIPGFHDEPLKGDRKGQRSIRLSIHYRAIYEIRGDEVKFVSVEEVTKHKY